MYSTGQNGGQMYCVKEINTIYSSPRLNPILQSRLNRQVPGYQTIPIHTFITKVVSN